MPPPETPLNYFIDRSLGRFAVPRGLRDAGLQVVTLAERYGTPEDQRIVDEVWLQEAGESGDVVLMKDRRIRYREAEREALIRHHVRAFCLSNGNLNSEQMVHYFVNNLERIIRACTQPGPFLYIVHSDKIEPLSLQAD